MAGHSLGRAGLGIAGFGLNFKSDSKSIITILRRRYAPFLEKTGRGLELAVSEGPNRREPFRPCVERAAGRLRLRRGDFSADILCKTGRGEAAAAANEQCLDAFLRSLISWNLLDSGGLMLHSAGLVLGGKAYVFPGVSGAGKSTLARLALGAGAEVISDEINLLRPGPRGWRAHGSPFWGEMRAGGRQASWPLGGLFLLKKSGEPAALPCSRKEAFKAVLRCLVNFSRSPEVSADALLAVGRLLAAVPARRLCFSKDSADFLELIR
jgi:hypothetical protein